MARKMIDFSKLSSEQLREFRDRYDVYIFDMDGTLSHLAGPPIDGVEDALNEIEKHGKSIHVITDNCLSTLEDIATKINKSHPGIKKENVMSCGQLAVRYLKEMNFNKKIYVMGLEEGIVTELKNHGFHVLHDEEIKKLAIKDLYYVPLDEGVGAVLVAADINFNYLKIFKAANFLANPEVLLLQTHVPNIASINPVLPAVGAMVASVKAASGRTESIAFGKTSDYCSKYLMSLGHPVERCLFIGDGLSNDIKAGNMCGMDTMLVLSGTCTLKEAVAAQAKNKEDYVPTYYADSVADLIKVFKTEE